MKLEAQQRILDEITTFYLESQDFNGLPLTKMPFRPDLDDDELRDHLRILIEEGKIALVFGDIHPNPHVRALPDEPKDSQLKKLETSLMVYACAYPTKLHLDECG